MKPQYGEDFDDLATAPPAAALVFGDNLAAASAYYGSLARDASIRGFDWFCSILFPEMVFFKKNKKSSKKVLTFAEKFDILINSSANEAKKMDGFKVGWTKRPLTI